MTNLELAIKTVKLLDIVPGKVERKGKWHFINPCPCCGGKDHFIITPNNNTYYSFNGCCKGGSNIKYFEEVEGLTSKESSIKILGMAGLGHDQMSKNEIDRIKQENKRLAEEQQRKDDIVYISFDKLTNFEKFLRNIPRKNKMIESLLSFIESYTMKFVTEEKEKHYDLCMNFIEEFNTWYKQYLYLSGEFWVYKN